MPITPIWITAIVYALAVYGLAGAMFACVFVARWITRLDPASKESSWAVRVLVWPGCAAMWPVLWLRLASARDASE